MAVDASPWKTLWLWCITSLVLMHFGKYDAPMSTNKPRITITLEPKTAAQLKRISELTGNSQSSMVSEVLEQSSDVFDRLILVLEAAEQAKASSFGVTAKRLEEAQKRIEGHIGIVLDEFDHATLPLFGRPDVAVPAGRDGSGAAAVRDAPAALADDAPTPLSNRGVRSTPDSRKVKPRKAVKC